MNFDYTIPKLNLFELDKISPFYQFVNVYAETINIKPTITKNNNTINIKYEFFNYIGEIKITIHVIDVNKQNLAWDFNGDWYYYDLIDKHNFEADFLEQLRPDDASYFLDELLYYREGIE